MMLLAVEVTIKLILPLVLLLGPDGTISLIQNISSILIYFQNLYEMLETLDK